MEHNQEYSNKITDGVIWKQLLIFFFPLLFGTFFQQLYNTADAIVVGQFVGTEALSAVGGSTGTLINLFIGFFIGISAGATVIIAQYYGGRYTSEVSRAMHTAIALAITGGIIITVIGIAGAPIFLHWMGTPKDVFPYALLYLRIYFSGMIANLIYNIGAGILRAIGDSKHPLYFLMTSVCVNIFLDLLFVAVFDWDVAGAALATVISQVCSAFLVCRTLMKTGECYQLHLKQIRFHRGMLIKIIRIGFPAGLQSLMYTSSNIIIQASMNSFGTDTIAAWTAYSKIDGLFWMTISAFGVSITTFVGQNYGSGKYDRVRKGIKVCLGMTMSVTIAFSVFLYFIGPYIISLFTRDYQVYMIGTQILHFLVPTFITYVLIEIISGSLRGMGNSLVPMLLTIFGICMFRVIWIYTAVPAWTEVKTLIVSYPLSWTITSCLFLVYFRHYMKRQKSFLPE